MAAYSHFLGAPVKVQYRLGDIFLSASGTFVADSGRSIFLEQHVEQRGKTNYFRWEIPYPYIHRIESAEQPAEPEEEPAASSESPAPQKAAAAAASNCDALPVRSGSIIPFPEPRRTA